MIRVWRFKLNLNDRLEERRNETYICGSEQDDPGAEGSVQAAVLAGGECCQLHCCDDGKRGGSPAVSYEETAAKYDEIERKIRKIKHALNVFNATTKVDGFDMTIDEMLVFLPQATDRLRKLSGMLAKPEKSRAENTGRTNIIEYEYLNYDLEKVQQDYDALMDRKSRALSALDVLNNTVQFEVEL